MKRKFSCGKFCTSQCWNRLVKNRCKDLRALALGRFLSVFERSSFVLFKGGSPSNIRLFSSRLARGDGVYRLRGRVIGDRRCRKLRLDCFEPLDKIEAFADLTTDLSGVLDLHGDVFFATLIELMSN